MTNLSQAAADIAQALRPQAQAAIDALATCRASLVSIQAQTPNVGSAYTTIGDAAKVLRNYALRIAEPLQELGVSMDVSAFDEGGRNP